MAQVNGKNIFLAGIKGDKGDKGDTGARLVSLVLQGQDANGGNIYLQTFEDGTTATFTAPKGDAGGFKQGLDITLIKDGLGSGSIGALSDIPIFSGGAKNDRGRLYYSIDGEEKVAECYLGVEDDEVILSAIEVVDGLNIADIVIPLGDNGITLLVMAGSKQTHYAIYAMGNYTEDTMPTIKILGIEYLYKNYTTKTYVDNVIAALEARIIALEAK